MRTDAMTKDRQGEAALAGAAHHRSDCWHLRRYIHNLYDKIRVQRYATRFGLQKRSWAGYGTLTAKTMQRCFVKAAPFRAGLMNVKCYQMLASCSTSGTPSFGDQQSHCSKRPRCKQFRRCQPPAKLIKRDICMFVIGNVMWHHVVFAPHV